MNRNNKKNKYKKKGKEWSETICTPELVGKICEHLMKGNYITTACQAEGISLSTYYVWMKKGKRDLTDGKEDSPYVFFLRSIEQAHAKGELHLVDKVYGGEKGVWTGSAWILERTRQDKFGRNQKIEVSKKVEHVIDAPPDAPDEYEKWLERHRPKEIQ